MDPAPHGYSEAIAHRPAAWENVLRCACCGNERMALHMKSRVPGWYAGRPLRLVECRTCGLAAASPRPAAEEAQPGYLEGDGSAREACERKLAPPSVQDVHRKHPRRALDHLGRPARTLLDMGCRAGTMMIADAGFTIEQVETPHLVFVLARARPVRAPGQGWTT